MARASRTSQARAARQAKMLYDMCAMAIVAGRADLDGADEVGFDIELPMFTVGRAGELANVQPFPNTIGLGLWCRSARMAVPAATRCEISPALRNRSS